MDAIPGDTFARSRFTGVADGDLRLPEPGEPEAPAARALVATLGGHGALAMVRQVHGARVVDVSMADGVTEADGIVSTVPGRVIAVRVADCVPVVLASPRGVAALHAGWRGTSLDIVRVGLRALLDATGDVATDVRAWIGPAICGACYEVSDEVVDAVLRVAPSPDTWCTTGPRGRAHVDLRAANLAILREAGIAARLVGPCTRCGEGYWSHRRDAERAGRQVGAIVLTPT